MKNTEHKHGFNIVDEETGEVLNHKGRRLDHIGREIPDPTPIPPPPGYKEVPSLFDTVREVVANERRLAGLDGDPETLEEAEDFDVEDEYDEFVSLWEGDFDVDVKKLIADVEERKSRSDGEPPATRNAPATPDEGTADSTDAQDAS